MRFIFIIVQSRTTVRLLLINSIRELNMILFSQLRILDCIPQSIFPLLNAVIISNHLNKNLSAIQLPIFKIAKNCQICKKKFLGANELNYNWHRWIRYWNQLKTLFCFLYRVKRNTGNLKDIELALLNFDRIHICLYKLFIFIV